MQFSGRVILNFGLAGTIGGLAWWWLRESAHAELRRVRRRGQWRVPREENRAFLSALGIVVAAIVTGGAAGLGAWSLVALLPFPIAMRIALEKARTRHRREMERTCLVSLHALKGFLEAGLNLSSSLFLLAERVPLEFPRKLSKTLARFDGGASLESCLASFLKRGSSRQVGEVVSALLAGYANGLPLLPFLEHAIGVMERHRRVELRVGRVKSVAIAQGLFAFFLPWGLLIYLCHAQEKALSNFLTDPGFLGAAAAALIAEIIGFGALWLLAKFH